MGLPTVLVVEDSEVEAQMLERGLRGALARTDIVLVNTTTQAEEYLFGDNPNSTQKAASPDLVVLDVRVPPSGGIDLLKRLRADSRTRSIPVLMVSSEMCDEDVRNLYNSGANSYLDKPVDFHEFVTMIGTAARYWLGLNLNTKQGR